jgi:putative addiction module component (TIGR02574 family)
MNRPESLLEELLKLGPAERIQLAQDLWDSVAASPESMPALTAAQLTEIERRLIEHARDPAAAIPWEEVRREALAPGWVNRCRSWSLSASAAASSGTNSPRSAWVNPLRTAARSSSDMM